MFRSANSFEPNVVTRKRIIDYNDRVSIFNAYPYMGRSQLSLVWGERVLLGTVEQDLISDEVAAFKVSVTRKQPILCCYSQVFER